VGTVLTTSDIVKDYLDLCHDPLKNIERWIEINKKRRSAHAPVSSHSPPDRSYGLRDDPLQAMQGGVDTYDRERRQGDHLSSQSGAGAAQPYELRPVQAEGGGLSGQVAAAADLAGPDSELSNIRTYYKGLIAAARTSLSPAEAAAAVRRLLDEEIVAVRAANARRVARSKDRHIARANQRDVRRPTHQGAPDSHPKQEFG
jgi:hypothetical protein